MCKQRIFLSSCDPGLEKTFCPLTVDTGIAKPANTGIARLTTCGSSHNMGYTSTRCLAIPVPGAWVPRQGQQVAADSTLELSSPEWGLGVGNSDCPPFELTCIGFLCRWWWIIIVDTYLCKPTYTQVARWIDAFVATCQRRKERECVCIHYIYMRTRADHA